MNTQHGLILIVGLGVLIGAYFLSTQSPIGPALPQTALAAEFDRLSTEGNSACSVEFQNSIGEMPDSAQIQGSCCSQMVFHRYEEQIEGLKKYRDIPEIPPDPYNVNAKLAKEFLGYYDLELTPEEQAAYDYAMVNSHEKGPCCCKCWHWFVYGGLAKKLIRERNFTGEQIVDVWDLSDGCGGAGEHHH